LHPYLAVAHELKRRGHRVLVAANAPYQSKVEALGLEFAALGPHIPEGAASRAIIERAMHPWRGSQWLFQSLLDPYTRQACAELSSACAGADLLLAHAIVLAAPLVARRGLRWASGALSPISFWSRFDPPTAPLPFNAQTPGAARPSALWSRVSRPLARELTRSWFPGFDALRRENGLATRPHPLFEAMFSGQATLALFSRELGLPQADWPARTIQCGAPVFEQPQVLGSQWRAWIEAGEPPIVWTLGSTAVHVAHNFWRHAFHAARDLHLSRGLRSLFLCGGPRYWSLPLPSPEWGLVADYAPFEQAFPRARIIVHQGGVGTTQAAMRAGAPQLIVPWAQDQPDNAARITARGLGLALHRARLNSLNAAQALAALADDPKYLQRARALSQAMQAAEPSPASAAADAVEALLPCA